MPRRRRCLPLVLATAMLAATAAPASAEILVDGGVITEPGGVVRTPDNALWVSDGASGVCRVNAAGTAYVFDDYCADPNHAEVPEDPNAPEVPELAPTAPTGAADMEFDALSSSFYVAEGTSKSSGVWRLHWNATTGQIDSATKIFNSAGDNRVFALTLARVPAPTVDDLAATTLEVDFATKRSPIVQRIRGAETGDDKTATNIGAAIAEEPIAIARFRGDVYLAEATGVTRIRTSAGESAAQLLAALPGVIPGSLLADPASDRLYVGMDSGEGADEILSIDGVSGDIESYEGGMASITALGLDSDGSVLAGDDPVTASGAVDAFFGGRIHKFAPAAFGRPRVEVLSGPPVVSPAPATGLFAATFTIQATSSATVQCKLDAAAWADCGSGADPITITESVEPGTHRISFRALPTGIGTPLVTERVFVVDNDAPTVSVDNAESDRVLTRRSLNLRFSASEGGVTFTCAVDADAPAPCSSPLALRNLTLGQHQVVVTGTDMAGHVSAPVTWTFEVKDPPPAPVVVDNSGSGSSNSGSSNSGPSRPADPRRPVAFSADSRNDPCRPGVTSTLDMRRPPAVIRARFATGQRPGYIRMVVLRKAKRAGRPPVKVLTMHRVVESSKPCTNVGWGLWRSEARKLRTGRYVLEVHAGATRSTLKRTWRGSLNVIKRTR